MHPKKISRNFARNLLRLTGGEAINASAFGNKPLLKRLEDDRVVSRIASGRNRAAYRCNDPAGLLNYLRLHFGVADLEAYIALLDRESRDGEESLQAATSTKMLRTKGMQGFFIKAFGAELCIGSSVLNPLPDGVEYFVSDFTRLAVPSDALLIGVENPECFQKADRLLDLFPQIPLVFVLRFYSNRLLDWLATVQNPYLHFGDFDPAGIAMYCNEFLVRLGGRRCRFFVPETIAGLMEHHGDIGLFEQQRHLWPPKKEIHQPELIQLIHLISKTGKGLEQEQLLVATR